MSNATSTAFKQMRRTPYQALGVILVLFTTFFLSYVYSYIFFGSQELLQYFETRPQVIAFFKSTAADSAVASIRDEMQSKPYVKSVTLVSKDQALAAYKKDNSQDPLLADLVTADVFPASIEVSGREITSLPQIQNDLNQHTDLIEEVVYQKDVIDTLAKWTHTIRIVGIGMISVLGLTSLLIVTIIISMKVLVKKQEIAIMRLLGATTFYVQAPFLVEGLFYGFTASLLGWLVAYTLLLYSTPWLVNFLGDIPLLPVPPIFLLLQLGIGMAAGLLLGVISSSLALRRYIK
jgi:cell division transport system permease protein